MDSEGLPFTTIEGYLKKQKSEKGYQFLAV